MGNYTIFKMERQASKMYTYLYSADSWIWSVSDLKGVVKSFGAVVRGNNPSLLSLSKGEYYSIVKGGMIIYHYLLFSSVRTFFNE